MFRNTGTTWTDLAAAVLLVLLTALAYSPGWNTGFVSDDRNAIVDNHRVTGPWSPGSIFGEFSWWGNVRADAPGYRPVTTATFALNHSVADLEPESYHATNIALHVGVSLLLTALAFQFGMQAGGAWAAGLLFALLPIHSEAVLWVVGRAELLAAGFFLAGAIAICRYGRSEAAMDSGHAGNRSEGSSVTGSLATLGAACTALFLGMLSKENTVTFLAVPAILALMSCTGRAPKSAGNTGNAPPKLSVRRAATATLALGVTFALYLALRASVGPVVPGGAGDVLDNPLAAHGTLTRLAGAVSVLGRYLWLTFWPGTLSIDYSFNALEIGPDFLADRYSLLGVTLPVLAGVLAWRNRRRYAVAGIGLLIAAASYSIVSNTVWAFGVGMGERLFYLPTAGLCLAAGTLVQAGLARRTALTGVVLGLVLLVAAGRIFDRAGDWQDAVTIFTAATEACPQSARAHMELGSALGAEGDIEGARRHHERALEIFPPYTAAAYNLGNALVQSGDLDGAAEALEHAVRIGPKMEQAWFNLGQVERMRGRGEAALEALNRGLRELPGRPALLESRAELLLALNRNRDAAEAYTRLMEARGVSMQDLYHRGIARHRLGGCPAAVEDYLASIRAAPDAPAAVYQAARSCLARLGRAEEARDLGPSGVTAP